MELALVFTSLHVYESVERLNTTDNTEIIILIFGPFSSALGKEAKTGPVIMLFPVFSSAYPSLSAFSYFWQHFLTLPEEREM